MDPYGGLVWCSFVKDPGVALRSARRGPFRRGVTPGAVAAAWGEFIPVLADKVRGGVEYLEGCAACELRADCAWCDVYGYLEHRRHGARLEYLCEVARESATGKARQARERRRYYASGG